MIFKTPMSLTAYFFDRGFAIGSVTKILPRLREKQPSDEVPVTLHDILIAAVLAAIGLAISVLGFLEASRHQGLLEYKNIWFQADIARVVDNMTNRGGSHWRTSVHPTSSIMLYPAAHILNKFGLTPLQASRAVVAVFAAFNPAMLYLVLRQIKLPRAVATVFAALFLASAAVVFWTSVVELYPIACGSVLPALFLMARGRPTRGAWWWLVSALTLSVTVTNWTIGLIATQVRWKFKPFLLISSAALITVLILSLAQFALFKDARIFIDPRGLKWDAVSFSEPVMQKRGQLHEAWNPVGNVKVLFVTTVVATPAKIVKQGEEYVATNQGTPFARDNYAGPIATIAWVGLLALGAWGAIRNSSTRLFAIGLGLMLFANAALHSVYGEVTFLYGMHVIPLLTLLAAMSWFTPQKWTGIALALLVITFGGVNNIEQFKQSTDVAGRIAQMPNVATIQAYK
jgi:hypothetical protein